MKIVIINKSDSRGGAAVVSYRLMEAFREEGIDATMLVAEKLTDSPFVESITPGWLIKKEFLEERLKIFIENGFNRNTLFKIDTGEYGLPLWKHPMVKDADAVLLNWVNQGVLSLKGVKKIIDLDKPVIWTMHDMWNMTGICHHAFSCRHFEKECGNCPLLCEKRNPHDLSRKIWGNKKRYYQQISQKFSFVAVSNWLEENSRKSSLMKNAPLAVIYNTFKLPEKKIERATKRYGSEIKLLFGAARLDDPIKGLTVLKEMTSVIEAEYPDLAKRVKIITFGKAKNQGSLEGFKLPLENLGTLNIEETKKAYENADILISAATYETLPTTLVEGQAYGCIPVSFNQGGQSDIITHLQSGYLASFSDDLYTAAKRLAEGVNWAVSILEDDGKYQEILTTMRRNVEEKFSFKTIAGRYLELIKELSKA